MAMATATALQRPLSANETADLLSRSRHSLVAFRHNLLSNEISKEVAPAPFHEDWSKALLYGTQHEAWEAFRESAKTQIVLRSFPLYALTFPSAAWDYIVIIKNNAQLAQNKLREIESEFLTNPVLCARVQSVNIQSAQIFEVVVEDDGGKARTVHLEAYGKGASVRGLSVRDRRPGIVIVDDPQDTDDALSPTVQATDWEWFLSDVMFLAKSCRIFLIGNNLGDRSVIERVFANPASLGFTCRRVPILENDRPTWPEKYNLREIEQERQSYDRLGQLDIWLRERMCVSSSEETRIFHEEDYRYYDHRLALKMAEGCRVFATLDPAYASSHTACYRAIVVNAVNSDGYWFILDVPFGRWKPEEHMDIIFETMSRWNVKTLGIEKGEYHQILEPFMLKEMPKRKTFFDIVPLEHGKVGSKLERIKMLSPRFRAHTIWFPQEAPWLAEMKTELLGVTREEIKSLFIDLVDALAMQEQIAQAPSANFNASFRRSQRELVTADAVMA